MSCRRPPTIAFLACCSSWSLPSATIVPRPVIGKTHLVLAEGVRHASSVTTNLDVDPSEGLKDLGDRHQQLLVGSGRCETVQACKPACYSWKMNSYSLCDKDTRLRWQESLSVLCRYFLTSTVIANGLGRVIMDNRLVGRLLPDAHREESILQEGDAIKPIRPDRVNRIGRCCFSMLVLAAPRRGEGIVAVAVAAGHDEIGRTFTMALGFGGGSLGDILLGGLSATQLGIGLSARAVIANGFLVGWHQSYVASVSPAGYGIAATA